MHFKVDRNDILEGVRWIMKIVGKKSVNPVLSNLFLTLEGNKLVIRGTDLDLYLSHELEVDGKEDGALGILGNKFYSLLQELPSEGEIEFIKKDNRGEIKIDKASYDLAGVEEGDFPSFELIEDENFTFQLDCDFVYRLLDKTEFAISTDMTRINLSALLLTLEEDKITSVATDGHKLALFKYNDETLDLPEADLLIPSKTVDFITRLTRKYSDKKVEIKASEKNIKFEIGGVSVLSHLVPKSFPNYDQVLPKNNDKFLRVDREVFLNTLRRMNILASPLTHLIRCHMGNDSIKMYAADSDIGGEAEDRIPAEYDDDEMDIGFNGDFLIETLEHLESDKVEISMGEQLTATILTPIEQKENEEYLTLLMPLRLPEE